MRYFGALPNLTCFHAPFFPFCPFAGHPPLPPFFSVPFCPFLPSKSALSCRAKGTAHSLERGGFRMQSAISTNFGKVISSRNLREKRSEEGVFWKTGLFRKIRFLVQGRKISPKRKFWGRTSGGHPGVIRADIRAQNFGQGGQNPGKNKHLGADIHDPKARTSMNVGDFQKLRSENFGLNFLSQPFRDAKTWAIAKRIFLINASRELNSLYFPRKTP